MRKINKMKIFMMTGFIIVAIVVDVGGFISSFLMLVAVVRLVFELDGLLLCAFFVCVKRIEREEETLRFHAVYMCIVFILVGEQVFPISAGGFSA